MNNETWKEVRGYAGLYEVSDLGRVRSLGRTCKAKSNSRQRKKARILTQEITIHGYCRVRLFDASGKAKHFAVHRLVAATFIGESDLEINHINEIKTDNRLSNLEYCTSKENCNHGTRNARISDKLKGIGAKKVAKLDDNGNILKIYNSRIEAQRETGVDARHIAKCCAGARKRAGGYYWGDI